MGEIPIVEDELRKAAGEEQLEDESVANTANQGVQKLVTADGTYATQSAFSGGDSSGGKSKQEKERPPFRKYLMEGDFFIGASLATVLTKLALRYNAAVKGDLKKQNRFTAEAMLVLSSILHLGKSGKRRPASLESKFLIDLISKVSFLFC